MSQLTLASSFQKLVRILRESKKTCTVVEQCCGGTISSSIMAQPGASSVFYGGSIVYNTKKGKPLLLNDDELQQSLLQKLDIKNKEGYIQSKLDWTAKTSVAFCEALETDYAIAEGGASGPTFGPDDCHTGFAVISVAGRADDNEVKVLKQKIIESTHNHRHENMNLFANAASQLLTEVIMEHENKHQQDEDTPSTLLEPTHDIEEHTITLDRATSLRSKPDILKEMEGRAKYVVVKQNDMLFRSSTDLALLSHEDVAPIQHNPRNQMTFLGILSNNDKTPIFGIDIRDDDNTDDGIAVEGCVFLETRTSAPLLPPLQNALALHMMAYANWQRKSCFCSSCGGPLTVIHAGTAQQCTSCNVHLWPRQDPSMIASITSRCGQRILLARSKRHPPKLHTVLAGFVEAGETFEAAVARETWEETGIRIDEGSVTYIGSQPWPFPQSCMIAFNATADDSQPLTIDTHELVDAKWFDRQDVLAATQVQGATLQTDVAQAALANDPTLALLIPPKRVIARTLIDTWLQQTTHQ